MKIQVCTWKMCKSRFSEYITKRIQWDILKFNLEHITLETCPCQWQCKVWPNVIIDGKIENYCDPIKISKIMSDKTKQRKNNQNNKETNKENNKTNQ